MPDTVTVIKPSFSAGELSPSLWGRVDFAKWHIGASVLRNCFVSYRGPASSRAGLMYCGKSLTPASSASVPPKIVRFQYNIFQSYILEFGQAPSGKPYMRVIANGAYVTETPKAVAGVTQANPAVMSVAAHGYDDGDWLYATGIGGMTQLNGRTFVVANATADAFALEGLFDDAINSLGYDAYTSGGTVARIYTNYDPPYALEDLPYLKVVQSADVMTLCCVNQQTNSEYPPIDLARLAANNWSFTETTFASAIAAPTGCTASATVHPSSASFTGSVTGNVLTASATSGTIEPGAALDGAGVPAGTTITGYDSASGGDGTYYLSVSFSAVSVPMTANASSTQYAYCVTAIDADTGEESVASNVAYITDSVDIALTAGSHVISWNPVPGASAYNIYQAPPSYDTAVPVGSVFAFIGQAFGTQFVNSNITADQTRTPPLHLDPFAPGAIAAVTITNQGTGYEQTSASASVISATGSGAVLIPVVQGGKIVAVIVQNGGKDYLPTDTILISGQGSGAGAAATAAATAISTDGTGGGSLGPVTISNGGSGYANPTVTAPAPLVGGVQATFFPPVVQDGAITAIYVNNPGTLYAGGQATLTITDSVPAGSGATAQLVLGPQTGTYPSVPDYFQSRRAYADTINNPDTLYLSQTGAYTNMDSSIPPVDSDAIVTTPWGQQVNGIQWLQPMPGGLIAATGQDAWQISGASGAGSTLTPASQSAQPQESNGFSPTVKPLKIDYDILYVQSLGYVVRDLQYNFFTNIYAGADLSVLSNHLFEGFQLTQWAWAKVPWKLVWATRNDGKFLSLTFDKEEQLQGWSRHDTNGLVAGNEVATEPPVDAPYFVVKRYIRGYSQWAYYIERMDNRIWQGPEDPWCIDAGLALPQPAPNATLSAQAAEGPGTIIGGYLATTGQNYSNPSAQIFDPLNTGSGAVISFTQVDGAISGFVIEQPGQDYSPGTRVQIIDPTGAGATFVPFVSQNVLFDASADVFDADQVGNVIRIGGGLATVSQVNSPTQVLAAITVPIVQTIPNDPFNIPMPAPAGAWTITEPVSSVTNLYHLEGMTVTGLADGAVIPPTTVVNGTIELAQPASSIKVGLPFIAQVQSMPTEIPSLGSIQGARKRVPGCTVRLEKSKGVQVGANQPVASMLDFQREIPWSNLVDLPEVPNSNAPDAALPLFSGDKFAPIDDDWQNYNGWEASPGMIAAQQTNPLPMNILAFVPKFLLGDNAAGA